MVETETRVQRLPKDPFDSRGGGMRVGTMTAAWRHKLLTLAPIVLLVGLAVAYGSRRASNSPAQSRLEVTGTDFTKAGALNGFSDATAALASTYTRPTPADAVVRPLAKKVNLTPGE